MPYFYTPPQVKYTVPIIGSQTVSYAESTTTWRTGGVWHNAHSPGAEQVGDVDVDATAGTLFFTSPTTIPDSLQPELAAFGVGTLVAV